MLTHIAIALSGVLALVVLRPIFEFLWDPRGFRKYPTQNFLSGITTLAYNWEIGRTHPVCRTKRLYELHQKKGPVIRVAPDWLSFSDSAAVKDIYGHKSPLMKNEVYDLLQENGQHLTNMTSKSYHSERRHMVASAYAPKNVESWEPKVSDLTTTLLKKMDALCTSPLPTGQVIPAKEDLKWDGNHWGVIFALEAVGRIAVSADLGFVEQGSDAFELVLDSPSDPEKQPRRKTVHAVATDRGFYHAISTLIWATEWFPVLRVASKYVSPWYSDAWGRGKDWRGLVTQLVTERITRFESGEQLDDLFQPLMEDRKTGNRTNVPTDDRLAEIDNILNAGIDGAGSSLVVIMYHLTKNPEAMKRARAEVDEALAGYDFSAVAPWSKVKNLPFLKACIDESLRLSPVVAGDLPRKTPPGRTYTVAGVTVPPGTNLSISPYASHRDPEIFPDPEAFRPDRWIIKGDDQLRRMLEVYLVFTMGSRMCMGKSITLLIQTVYLATLLRRYEFALPSPDWELKFVEGFNMWPQAMPMKVWRREHAKQVAAA